MIFITKTATLSIVQETDPIFSKLEYFIFPEEDCIVFQFNNLPCHLLKKLVNVLDKNSHMYIVLTCEVSNIRLCMQNNIRFLYYPPTITSKSIQLEDYLKCAFASICHNVEDVEIINNNFQNQYKVQEKFPIIGYYRNPLNNSAGILPIIHYEGELYCALGIDANQKKYSDFGGGFDEVFRAHRGDESYKNDILGDKKIYNGDIDQYILYDHYIYHEFQKNLINNIKELDRSLIQSNNNYYDGVRKKSYKNNGLGYGDINSKYTAFREFYEETSCKDKYGNIRNIFKPDKIYRKLYIDNSYIYLGGDKLYKYDLFVLILDINDIADDIKSSFIKCIESYKQDTSKYVQVRTDNIGNEINIPIIGNKEMYGIELFHLGTIIDNIKNINYIEYRSNKSNNYNKYAMYRKNKEPSFVHPNYHENIYRSKLLDNMRPCFADALIKYGPELSYIYSHFNDMRPIILPLKT